MSSSPPSKITAGAARKFLCPDRRWHRVRARYRRLRHHLGRVEICRAAAGRDSSLRPRQSGAGGRGRGVVRRDRGRDRARGCRACAKSSSRITRRSLSRCVVLVVVVMVKEMLFRTVERSAKTAREHRRADRRVASSHRRVHFDRGLHRHLHRASRRPGLAKCGCLGGALRLRAHRRERLAPALVPRSTRSWTPRRAGRSCDDPHRGRGGAGSGRRREMPRPQNGTRVLRRSPRRGWTRRSRCAKDTRIAHEVKDAIRQTDRRIADVLVHVEPASEVR